MILGVLKRSDPSVLLNLEFNGSNGSQVFSDSSPYGRVMSVLAGSPALSTTSPLSGASSLLLGVGGSIKTPDFTTPAATYIKTIEFRIKADLATIASGESQGVFVKGYSNSSFQYYSHQCLITRNASGNGGKVRCYWYNAAVSQIAMYLEVTITDLSQNNHIAFTQRSNGIYAAYLNGVLSGTSGFVQNYEANTLDFIIGATVYDWALSVNTARFTGYLDNFRVSNIDSYPTAFTPPV